MLRQLLAATLCAVLALPACSSAAPLSSSTPSHIYDAETLSETRVWGSNEKILLHIRATLLVSEKQHWGYEKCRWENVVGSGVTYDYDAFGKLIHQTGTTYNNYLFAGEQFDPDLNLYYNRARYLNVSTGRFWSMDTFEGTSSDPTSLHKYLYTGANPVNRNDPSGQLFDDIGGALTSAYTTISSAASAYPTAAAAFQFVSAALTIGLFASDEDFRAVYVASGGNPAQALATEFSTLLDEAGAAIAKDVVQDAATTGLSLGAKFARTDVVKPGERFVRVAATPETLNFSFKSPGGALARTYAFPKTFSRRSAKTPLHFRILETSRVLRQFTIAFSHRHREPQFSAELFREASMEAGEEYRKCISLRSFNMTTLPTKFDLPGSLSEKVVSFGESSYGVTIVTLVLKDGTRVTHVHVAWGRNVIKATGAEEEALLSKLDPADIVDVLPEA